ncbi:glycoside hydrolase [Vararia minispora EC-137]|uniref:Glycoside hydrolase n=1 Tax=Vararia minispora EC-137 TaxID=1314806 RepID=A0ACB8QRA8_9AGAM|nr:glycoside hydrolase [Vararia minispora EC-137]
MFTRYSAASGLAIAASTLLSSVSAFDASSRTNLAVYWGQNSYGATHTSDTSNWQQSIGHYCQDDTINAIPVAFLNVAFSTGGLPSIDLANICNINGNSVFPGTQLPDCSFLASEIQACQARGKIVTISIGGATGGVAFTGVDQARQFADTVWNLFLGGSSSTRPFGAAVLDGVDLDLEGGSPNYWSDFVTEIRAKASGASKPYYVTGAPQCPFPDAYLGTALNAVGFDAVYVQFYNNYCGVNNYGNPNAWNFAQWDSWAKSSPNPNVKVYIGVPASSTAAGSGYVDSSTLGGIIKDTASAYSSFGGIMLWDASQAYANGRFDQAVKSLLNANVPGSSGGSGTTTTTGPTTTVTTTTTTTSAPPTTTSQPSGSCGSVAGWVANVAYVQGDQVTYNGYLYTANQWNYDEVPDGPSGAWTKSGPCATTNATRVKPLLTSIPAASMVPGSHAPTESRREFFRFKRA